MSDETTVGNRVARPPAERPLLIYDGDCGFCRRWIERWRGITRDGVDYEPSQAVGHRFPEIPGAAYAEAVQLVGIDGTVTSGAAAVYGALAGAPHRIWRLPLAVYRHVPGAAAVAEASYRFVARRRTLFSRATRHLWGEDVTPPTFALSSALMLRLLGLVYLVAFVSFWVQLDGLVGRDGILPAGPWLESLREQAATEDGVAQLYRRLPTLAWVDTSDGFLHLLAASGVVLSLLLLVGVAPIGVLAGLFVAYLSLVNAGRTFMSFQWDSLLLEAGFLALFVAPLRVWPTFRRTPAPSRIAVFLMHWLLFRLMVSSGVVKLLSGDAVWWDLTALEVHYETQPLPTWIAWYVHQLPGWFHRITCFLMFVIELAVPFLIFAPRRLRHLGCALLLGLQVLIAATGNYTFFNLLTAVLCLLLVDDTLWPASLRPAPRPTGRRPRGRWPAWALALPALILLVVSVQVLAGTWQRPEWLKPRAVFERLEPLEDILRSLRVVSGYGLFADMTETRPEIVLEGSDDLATWLPYGFRHKPGDPAAPPGFVAPYQPRLDWQMWFAALGDYRHPRNRWFGELMRRLLEGSPEVLALLGDNPFPEGPPRFLRAVLYDYRFTDRAARRESGHWWRRTPVRLYMPVVRLEGGRLVGLFPPPGAREPELTP